MKYFDVEAVLPLYFADQEKSYVEYLHDARRNIQTQLPIWICLLDVCT